MSGGGGQHWPAGRGITRPGRPVFGPKAGETPPTTAQPLGVDGRGRHGPSCFLPSRCASAIVTRMAETRWRGSGRLRLERAPGTEFQRGDAQPLDPDSFAIMVMVQFVAAPLHLLPPVRRFRDAVALGAE